MAPPNHPSLASGWTRIDSDGCLAVGVIIIFLPTYQHAVAAVTVIAMDGELVRTSPDHWTGTLNGYTVDVFKIGRQWNY